MHIIMHCIQYLHYIYIIYIYIYIYYIISYIYYIISYIYIYQIIYILWFIYIYILWYIYILYDIYIYYNIYIYISYIYYIYVDKDTYPCISRLPAPQVSGSNKSSVGHRTGGRWRWTKGPWACPNVLSGT